MASSTTQATVFLGLSYKGFYINYLQTRHGFKPEESNSFRAD
jgi:hypothetical protein